MKELPLPRDESQVVAVDVGQTNGQGQVELRASQSDRMLAISPACTQA